MTTKQHQKARPRATQRPAVPGGEALTLALDIVLQRVLALPPEDREDLAELLQEIPKARDEEELTALLTSIREILAQAPVRLLTLEQTVPSGPTLALQQWIDYAAHKVRELRKSHGWTQEELAAKSGIPQSHISRLEGAKHSPSRKTLERIAKALGVKVSAFDPSA